MHAGGLAAVQAPGGAAAGPEAVDQRPGAVFENECWAMADQPGIRIVQRRTAEGKAGRPIEAASWGREDAVSCGCSHDMMQPGVFVLFIAEQFCNNAALLDAPI